MAAPMWGGRSEAPRRRGSGRYARGTWGRGAGWLGFALVLGSVFALVSCSASAPRAEDAAAAKDAETVVDVETATVRRGAIDHWLSAPGALEARRESRIGPEVQGTILHVHVDEGDRVEAGALLFEIDPEPFRLALRQAVAGLDLAHAERLQVEADLARAQLLRSEGILSAQQIERLETAAVVARARERHALDAAALARHHLAQTQVRAPYAGGVAARLADEGTTALVQPQTIVLVLQETSVLEARAAIPEGQLLLVHRGDPARIRIEGLATVIDGEVSAVSESIDPATRTYGVRIRVPNPEGALKAGVFAQVDIRPRSLGDVVLVPRDAIDSEGGASRLLVVRDGVVTSERVKLGVVSERDAQLLAGPPVGAVIVVGASAGDVAPGMRVRARKREEPGA
ncbi:MAG TPA: efflux RND transporter periplasmic adaptor subunit [Myxococcota bacterium]|nr:efflux RND transporter periplasmic adaptor subunit [Myxococcota bacterium]